MIYSDTGGCTNKEYHTHSFPFATVAEMLLMECFQSKRINSIIQGVTSNNGRLLGI